MPAPLPVPRLIACDLDGTLLTNGNCIPQPHVAAVATLEAMGIAVVIVTGRPMLSTLGIQRSLGLSAPLVCFNGVWVGHPGAPPLHQDMLAGDEVRVALEPLMARQRGSINLYPGPDRWLMDRLCPTTAAWPQLYGVPITVDAAILDDWQEPSCKILYADEPAEISALCPQLQAHFQGRFHVVISQEDRLEITRPGATKDRGLAVLCQHLGIAQAETWAVGDSDNDIEMLRWAGLGLAMGQASAGVKAAAGQVLPSINEAGMQVLPDLVRQARAAAGHG